MYKSWVFVHDNLMHSYKFSSVRCWSELYYIRCGWTAVRGDGRPYLIYVVWKKQHKPGKIMEKSWNFFSKKCGNPVLILKMVFLTLQTSGARRGEIHAMAYSAVTCSKLYQHNSASYSWVHLKTQLWTRGASPSPSLL